MEKPVQKPDPTRILLSKCDDAVVGWLAPPVADLEGPMGGSKMERKKGQRTTRKNYEVGPAGNENLAPLTIIKHNTNIGVHVNGIGQSHTRKQDNKNGGKLL